jgi:hypothetical protein
MFPSLQLRTKEDSFETLLFRRMPSSGTVSGMALLRPDVSEEHSASIIRVTKIGKLRTTLAIAVILLASVASYG